MSDSPNRWPRPGEDPATMPGVRGGYKHRKPWLALRFGIRSDEEEAELRASMREIVERRRAEQPPDPEDKVLADQLHDAGIRCWQDEGDEQGHLLDARRILGWSSEYEPIP